MKVHVYTWKEGVLSPIAHDLRLSAGRVDVTRTGDRVVARVATDSLTVDGVVRHGSLDPTGLSAKDKREIEQNIREKVLHVRQFPEALFEGNEAGEGTLTLHGRTLPIVIRDGEVEIVPSRWGIAPFRAMLGALRVQDRVRIVITPA